jgi:hypothetical protein
MDYSKQIEGVPPASGEELECQAGIQVNQLFDLEEGE